MMYNVTLTWSHGFIEKYEIMNPSATKLESEVGRINTLNNVVDYSITCNGETIAKKGRHKK